MDQDYKAWLKECRRKQTAYIREQQRKMATARRLLNAFVVGMNSLGLHPLDRSEIYAREQELAEMLRRVMETHGDTPGNRAIFEGLGYAQAA